jgi:hypothetical protein
MPDADGRFKGISVPRLPWQEECLPIAEYVLVDPPDNFTAQHTACGTADCCGKCPTASGRM